MSNVNQTYGAAPAERPAGPTSDEKTLALVAHLISFSGSFIPFGNIIGPLVIYLWKRDESAFVRIHALESLNFQISLTIYALVCVATIIGIILVPVIVILGIIFPIVATLRSSEGGYYSYPLSFRFVS